MRLAIIGAGISGLSAAYRFNQICPTCGIDIFDRRSRIGGLLETLCQDGYEIEQSADNFITTIPWGIQLCKELGLTDKLVQTNSAFRRTYVVRNGKLHLLPDGFLMMAPTKLYPMATTPILSIFGKIRAGLELFIPARKDNNDESMADFVRRRLGREVFERLVEPLVSGVYAADMEKLSLMATLPRFREMERDHGSLIRAMQKQLAANRSANLAEQSGARYSMFVTIKGGLSVICNTIAEKLPTNSIKLGQNITAIKKTNNNKWILTSNANKIDSHNPHTPNNTTTEYDAVILSCQAHDAAELITEELPEISQRLAKIEHEGTAIATFAFNSNQIKQNIKGMGFVVPKIENSAILAGSFSSLKYPHRAPEGKQLIRIFAGGARMPNAATMNDNELVPLLLGELRRVVEIVGEPLLAVVSHWARTMPQYHIGHRDLINEIETLSKNEPNFALAGNAFHGIGIPNCIRSGFDAAEKISQVS
ncbi:MAG: protoporphyrinogen oxidase [Planctomycetaceae bacterium]|nr:protoporphyrinogen oxidase [Planctomycetaceae bacterium]